MIKNNPVFQLTLPVLASSATAIIVALPFHYPELYFLTWCGLVPWLWAINTGTSMRAYGLGLLFGVCLFATTTYWVKDFLLTLNPEAGNLGWVLSGLYWIYAAQIPALLALSVRWLTLRKKANFLLSFPLIGTLLFFAIPVLFPADLATSQTQFLIALQPISATGAIGLHCVILLCNSLVYQWITISEQRNFRAEVVGWIFIICWFVYGYSTLNAPSATDTYIRVGLVQPNHPPSVDVPEPEPGYSHAFSPELELTQLLITQGAELIIWPELRYTGFFGRDDAKANVYQLLENSPAYLWIQDLKEQDGKIYNVSVLLAANKIHGEYYKQERIPFGEKMPFDNIPFLNTLTTDFFSDFYKPVATRQQQGQFLLNGIMAQAFICYESTKPFYINQFLNGRAQRPAFLLFQSNDSWFGNSIQPELHQATGILRGIEQGLPTLHVINNGPSTISDRTGERQFSSPRFMRSGYLIHLPLNRTPVATHFSQHPYAFISVIAMLTLVYLIFLTVRKGYSAGESVGLA